MLHEPSPSLIFQLAMFPSVIVGDMAGIKKFWAARHFAHVPRAMKDQSQQLKYRVL